MPPHALNWSPSRQVGIVLGYDTVFLTNDLSLALGRLSLKPDDVVVDVGGNVGMLSLNMLTAYPYLRFVVQDLPNVILGAEQVRRSILLHFSALTGILFYFSVLAHQQPRSSRRKTGHPAG